MMKYALLLILSFLTARETAPGQSVNIKADSLAVAETTFFAEPPAEPGIPLDYEINETTVKGFITSLKDKYPVQLGAFRVKYNAEAFLNEVIAHIDKDAIMFREDGLYKIRISRSRDSVAAETSVNAESLNNPAAQAEATAAVNDTIQSEASYPDSTVTGLIINEPSPEKATLSRESAGELIIGNNSPWLKRITYFGKSLALINALIITIVICIISMILLLLFILLNRRRMEKREKLHQYLMEKYQELIINYLFGNATPDDFRQIASDTYRRQVLIDQMIDVSINLKGEEARKLLGLYKHLGLDRDSIERARDHRWHKKIKGFRELAFMNIKDANDTIYKALNSSNEILRMEAQIALVRLGDESAFDFLSQLERPFSLWEQITLHELIVQHNIPLPQFKQWLTSSNPTVVMFALRMIREFKQAEAEEAVHDTIMHPDPAVKQLAIQVAGDMNMRSTLETMKHMYKFQEYKVGLEIIRSMGKMPDLAMLGFLKLVLDKEDDVQLQIEATKAIENNGEEGVKALVKIMKSEYKNYNIIVRHVLDRRIF
jgi:hypothetical protein